MATDGTYRIVTEDGRRCTLLYDGHKGVMVNIATGREMAATEEEFKALLQRHREKGSEVRKLIGQAEAAAWIEANGNMDVRAWERDKARRTLWGTLRKKKP